MKIRKFLSFLLVIALVCTMFSVSAGAETKKASWTILLYLCGTDLESDFSSASHNIDDMLKATDSDEINLVIETGGTKEWKNGIRDDVLSRYIRKGDELQRVETLDLASMGDPDTLASFVTWGLENYPAERVGLILWDHGGSSIGGVCFDDLFDRDSLSLAEIRSALNTTSSLLPNGFEFIGFDACLMSSLEIASIVAPYAKYMYASEETEPGTGWDYKTILNWLADHPDADGREFGEIQCSSYKDFQSDEPSETFSIIDLSKVDAIVTAFEAAAKEINESEHKTDIIRAILRTECFGMNNRTEGYINMVDIKGIMEKIEDYAPSAPAVIDAIEDAMVCHINGLQHEDAGGLSIYYPIRLEGTKSVPIYTEICPSPSYLSFISLIADDVISTGSVGDKFGEWASVGESDAFQVTDAYITENGTFTAVLDNMDQLSRASCVINYVSLDGEYSRYVGETTKVNIDVATCTVTDRFDGKCLLLGGSVVPVAIVSQNDEVEIYTAPILMAGKEMNLRVIYYKDRDVYSLDGICQNVDSEKGMASRTMDLKDGDVFQFCYYDLTDEENKEHLYRSPEITVSEDLTFEVGKLPEGYYLYNVVLYDLSGNSYALDGVTFKVDENGAMSIPWDLNEEYKLRKLAN